MNAEHITQINLVCVTMLKLLSNETLGFRIVLHLGPACHFVKKCMTGQGGEHTHQNLQTRQ